MKPFPSRLLSWLGHNDRGKKIIVVSVLPVALGLMFYNLGLSSQPRLSAA